MVRLHNIQPYDQNSSVSVEHVFKCTLQMKIGGSDRGEELFSSSLEVKHS